MSTSHETFSLVMLMPFTKAIATVGPKGDANNTSAVTSPSTFPTAVTSMPLLLPVTRKNYYLLVFCNEAKKHFKF